MIAVPGLVDAHTHLLRSSAGIPFPWEGTAVANFHQKVANDGKTPMDVPEPARGDPLPYMAQQLYLGLASAAEVGLVEVTEMGMRTWWYLEALSMLQESMPLPARVRIYLASGLAEKVSLQEMDARRSDCGPWVKLEGVKFYADGWLTP